MSVALLPDVLAKISASKPIRRGKDAKKAVLPGKRNKLCSFPRFVKRKKRGKGSRLKKVNRKSGLRLFCWVTW
ncbi:MAG: hypothetical protein J6S75_07335, partial [Thermoguttaceae bacterium]|nr:hypothetical protein [Thermoguttaceae bacterium]